MYYQLVCFRNDWKNYGDAQFHDGVYHTTSTMDNLAFDGGGSNGLFDLLEIIGMIEEAIGSGDLEYGIVHNDYFLRLEDLVDAVQALPELNFGLSQEDLDQLAETKGQPPIGYTAAEETL